MKRIHSFLIFAAIAFFMSGCVSTAHVEKDDAVNFNKYKTYAWVEENTDWGRIKKNSLQESALKKAVTAELARANWTEEKKNPDILLKHDILVEKKLKESSNPVYSQPFGRRFFNPYSGRFSYVYFPSRFVGYDDDQYVTREGTLTISMIDAKTDKVIWQGWNTDEIDNKNLTSKEIQGSVKNIFRKFDVVKE